MIRRSLLSISYGTCTNFAIIHETGMKLAAPDCSDKFNSYTCVDRVKPIPKSKPMLKAITIEFN